RFGTLPSVDQLKSWLQQGADPVSDPATGITLGRLDIAKAAGLILQPPAPPAPVIAASPWTVTPSPAPAISAAPAVSTPAPAPRVPVSQVTSNASVILANPSGPSEGSRSNQTTTTVPNYEDLFKEAMSVWSAANGTAGWTTGAVHVRVWSA